MNELSKNGNEDGGDTDRPRAPGHSSACEAGLSKDRPGNGSVDFSVAVVLPAGGSGERTGLSTPKQFCTFLNRPLISYTIQAFERVSWIDSVVVVVAKESLGLMMDIAQRFHHRKVRVVVGGSTRHRSIFNGIRALGGEDGAALIEPKVVIIHDAVRPFVEEGFLFKIAMAARDHGAAGAVRPLVSTVIAPTAEGCLDHALERDKYRASETPQGFLYHVIQRAYQRCSESDFDFGTECLHLVLTHCGTRAWLIDGPPTLWKVTYRRDLAAAESIIKETLSRSACVITGASPLAQDLSKALQSTLGALDMELELVPSLKGDNARVLSKEWNFIQVSVNNACVCEVEEVRRALDERNQALLHPVVMIWVQLSASGEVSVSGTGGGPEAMSEAARGARLRNILLYGIQLHYSKDADRWERSIARAAEITSALIRDRNPALTGQLLQA